ncbi:MAG: threonine synthase [Pseudomonadota bacterium]
MKYVSTRGQSEPVDFLDACLAGLAPDGGLYVPETWPRLEPANPQESYVDLATRILSAFAGDALPKSAIQGMCERAYATFAHEAVTPLVQMAPNQFLLELHHGPTLAFKDVAMQFIAQLYDYALEQRDQRMTVICATSGDTGGAAAAAFAGSKRVSLVILHPDQRVSPVQRLFMTTTGAENVTNLAVEGDFDDCQAIVKSLFADRTFSADVSLSGVNSINWARIAAQSVYYAYAQAALGPSRALRFVVPSGNMGDALAGYVAARCGLLAGFEAVCAVNENKSLQVLLEEGHMRRMPAIKTPSPAMDISVPSNFERLFFEASGRDGDAVRATYQAYAQSGETQLPAKVMGPLQCMGLSAQSVSNGETLAELRTLLAGTGTLQCPHTAVGIYVARSIATTDTPPTVVLATAHAAKFPETLQAATGQETPLPDRCQHLKGRNEDYTRIAADVGIIKSLILGQSG